MPPSARHFEALGTTCSLFVAGAPGEHLERGEAWVRALQARLTRFEPDSELSRFNASAGAWIPVSEELEDLLREALRSWELSGGLVNVAVLSAMHGIGYRRPLREGPSGSIAVATPLPALPDVLEVTPGRARLRPEAGLDLGGLAKGWMADRLARRLGDNALANLGGDLAAQGAGFSSRRIILRHLLPNVITQAIVFAMSDIVLSILAIVTLGYLGLGIQPPTPDWGAMIADGQDALGEVSVVAPTALEAEVLAKTALLLGSGEAPAYLDGKAAAWWLLP